MSFPIERVRGDFPILSREVNGQPLAYLDSAASAQKPQAVIDRELDFYRHGYAAVHRGIHTMSAEATQEMEAVREKVAAFINAGSAKRSYSLKAPPKASIWWPTALVATSCSPVTASSSPRWSTMPTSCPGRCWRRSVG
jgi:hypothetical protein